MRIEVELEKINSGSIKRKFIRFLELLLTALLFGTQTVLNAGTSISIMTLPLLPLLANYLSGTGSYSLESLKIELQVLTLNSTFLVGRIVAIIGLILLLIACIQWIIYHNRKVGLFKTGLYGKVRHPQFTGIIIVTLGLTIMTMTWSSPLFPQNGGVSLVVFKWAGLWLLQVFGYIGIAKFEDWWLSKKFKEEHLEYKKETPLLYPIRNPKKIPELAFTIIITLIIFAIIVLLPYELIGFYSSQLYTNPFY